METSFKVGQWGGGGGVCKPMPYSPNHFHDMAMLLLHEARENREQKAEGGSGLEWGGFPKKGEIKNRSHTNVAEQTSENKSRSYAFFG